MTDALFVCYLEPGRPIRELWQVVSARRANGARSPHHQHNPGKPQWFGLPARIQLSRPAERRHGSNQPDGIIRTRYFGSYPKTGDTALHVKSSILLIASCIAKTSGTTGILEAWVTNPAVILDLG